MNSPLEHAAERPDRDDELRQLLSIGSVDGIALLWDLNAQTMFNLLLSILQSASDAEDVLHNVFLKIGKISNQIAQAKNIHAYVFQLTRNAGIDAYQKNKTKRSRHQSSSSLNDAGSQLIVTDEGLDSEMQKNINTALQLLPQEQRSVIMLKIYDNKTFAEISDILDISANTCASRYRYAIEKLRESLKGVWP